MEEKNIPLIILGIVAVIAVIGLILLMTGNRTTGQYVASGIEKRYGGGAMPGKAVGIYENPKDGATPQEFNSQLCGPGFKEVSYRNCILDPFCVLVNDEAGCRPFGLNTRGGQDLTSAVSLNQKNCFTLAVAYDGVVTRTLNMVGVQPRDTTTINPCTGTGAEGTERIFDATPPQRDLARIQYTNGDVQGLVGGLQKGSLQYSVCAGFKAKVTISGVDICNTLT